MSFRPKNGIFTTDTYLSEKSGYTEQRTLKLIIKTVGKKPEVPSDLRKGGVTLTLIHKPATLLKAETVNMKLTILCNENMH